MNKRQNRRTKRTTALCLGVLLLGGTSIFGQAKDRYPSTSLAKKNVQVSGLSYDRIASLLEQSRYVAMTLPHGARMFSLNRIALSYYRRGKKETAKVVFEEARKTAAIIEDNKRRNYALLTLVTTQAEVGAVYESRTTAALILDESLLHTVADALQRAGDYAGALEILLRTSPSETLFSYKLSNLAIDQAKAGDITGAQRVARKIEDQHYCNRALEEICMIEAKAGHIEAALGLASTLKSESQASTKRAIAVALIESGRTAEALKVARDMNETLVLTRVADAQIKANDIEGAEQTSLEALTLAQLRSGTAYNTVVYAVARLGEVGDIDGARKLQSRVSSEEVRAMCEQKLIIPELLRQAKFAPLTNTLARLSALKKNVREEATYKVAEYLISINDLKGAVVVIDRLDKSEPKVSVPSGIPAFLILRTLHISNRNLALKKLASAQTDALDWQNASDSINKITSPSCRQFALKHLLSQQLKSDEFDAALKTARQLPTFHEISNEPGWTPSPLRDFDEDAALCDVSIALCDHGDFAQARAVCREIHDNWPRNCTLREISVKEAAKVVCEVKNTTLVNLPLSLDPLTRNRAWEYIAITKARTGDFAGALDAARRIDDKVSERIVPFESSLSRAGAMSRIARFLIAKNQFDEGERILYEALKLTEEIENLGQRETALVEIIEAINNEVPRYDSFFG